MDVVGHQNTITLSKLTVKTAQARTQLVLMAVSLGLTEGDFSEVRKQQLLAQIEIQKQRELKQLEFDSASDMTELQLRAAFAYQDQDLAKALRIRQQLTELREELHLLETSNKPWDLIQAQARDFRVLIGGLEAKLARLVQGDNGQEFSGSDESPYYRRLPEPDMGESEE